MPLDSMIECVEVHVTSRINAADSSQGFGWALIYLSVTVSCVSDSSVKQQRHENDSRASLTQEASWLNERQLMIDRQIRGRSVQDPRVLAAMRAVPRHRFVPSQLQKDAYADTPLPIGFDQTISQPYIVAYMTEALQLPPAATVLEVGTGSGYQAAVLAELAANVYSIEIVPELAERSKRILTELGYDNVHVRLGDGYDGWPDAAPFDGIIVTAAPDHVPPALVAQLAVGARLVIPVGRFAQEMRVVTKTMDGPISETTIPVRFVPMTGEAQLH